MSHCWSVSYLDELQSPVKTHLYVVGQTGWSSQEWLAGSKGKTVCLQKCLCPVLPELSLCNVFFGAVSAVSSFLSHLLPIFVVISVEKKHSCSVHVQYRSDTREKVAKSLRARQINVAGVLEQEPSASRLYGSLVIVIYYFFVNANE